MTGSLHEKNGKWQLVLYGAVGILFPNKQTDNPDKKVCKWISSNLEATSKNRLLASKMLFDKITEYEQQEKREAEFTALANKGIDAPKCCLSKDVLFTDYIADWLARKQGQIQQSTWEKYQIYAERHIIPYFAELNVGLSELKPRHFVDYYQYKTTGGRLDGKEGGLDITSVRGHAALIRTILNEAVIFECINGNPAQNVPVPKRARTAPKAAKNVYMTAAEANNMLKTIEKEEIFPLVYVAIIYGLRKSEVLGLKWDAVDFDKDTLEIKSTVVKNKTIVYKDTTKTESSHETYELLPEIKALLLNIKSKQEHNRQEYEELYTHSDYIFTQSDGRLYRPDSVTRTFQRALRRHKLPEMRFHDLRHSTASILFDKGWDLEAVKSWLRHADIETTSNIYLHVSKERKHLLAEDMHGTFFTPNFEQNYDTESGEKRKNAS
ncbi:MAG: site-specific integrase [Ruminococcaceae bacterium]|nr:site-specific integrase [Oscillospiraceae bacterium]MBP1547327.1 site-specific integrase [Oscillospiraceae bacterium]